MNLIEIYHTARLQHPSMQTTSIRLAEGVHQQHRHIEKNAI